MKTVLKYKIYSSTLLTLMLMFAVLTSWKSHGVIVYYTGYKSIYLTIIPVALILITMGSLIFAVRYSFIRHVRLYDGKVCIKCGYTLDIESDQQPCPECGVQVDLVAFRAAWQSALNHEWPKPTVTPESN